MDISGEVADIHMRNDAKNLVTTAITIHLPEQKRRPSTSFQLMQQKQGQQAYQTQSQQGALQNAGNEGRSQQLNLRGFDNIGTFSEGEKQWQSWSWKIKTATSGMNSELAEMLDAAETTGIGHMEEIFGEDQVVDVNREGCTKSRREMS